MKTFGMKHILVAGLTAVVLLIGGNAQAMPSPRVEYTSVRDAWAVAGLPVYTPTLLISFERRSASLRSHATSFSTASIVPPDCRHA